MRIEIKPEDLYDTVVEIVDKDIIPSLRSQTTQIGMKAGNQLRNNTVTQFDGPRSGRVYYQARGVQYRASAPGESPAIRTGNLKKSFMFRNKREFGANGNAQVTSEAYSDVRPPNGSQYNYAYLDVGMQRGGQSIAPRPYSKKALEKTVEDLTALINRIKL